jgi:hypothetical protein
MTALARFLRHPLPHILFLVAITACAFLHSRISPMDDAALYQKFAENLAHGIINFSILGFHGASLLTLPVYLLTGSPLAGVYTQILCALVIIPLAYFAARALLADTFSAILFAYVVTLMPFFLFPALRGFTFASFTALVLLAMYLRAIGSRFAWIALGLSFITKPFSIALAPLFLLWEPATRKNRPLLERGSMQFALALTIPAIYLLWEFLQTGHIAVGAHPNIEVSNVFPLVRFPLNLLHGVQMLFSIHNFYFPNPAQTTMGNLVHSSPLLMVFGIVSLLYPHGEWSDLRLARAVTLSAIVAYILAALLDHMDQFYIETAVLLLTFAAIPYLAKRWLLLPLVLGTLHFQFFYLYLQYRTTFFPNITLFIIPIAIDAVALLAWAVLVLPDLLSKRR